MNYSSLVQPLQCSTPTLYKFSCDDGYHVNYCPTSCWCPILYVVSHVEPLYLSFMWLLLTQKAPYACLLINAVMRASAHLLLACCCWVLIVQATGLCWIMASWICYFVCVFGLHKQVLMLFGECSACCLLVNHKRQRERWKGSRGEGGNFDGQHLPWPFCLSPLIWLASTHMHGYMCKRDYTTLAKP